MEALNDKSPLEYGRKHRGEKLGNVPASYLIWLYNEASKVPKTILDYIRDNYDQIEKEAYNEMNYR